MEWMIQKNVNKEGREIPEQEGEFVSSFFLKYILIVVFVLSF